MSNTINHFSKGVLSLEEQRKTLHKNLEFTATEQYKLLRANLEFILSEHETCPVIGVTSSVRGEGKSTTAVNLSYVLAEKGSRVLLIDGDLRIPTVAKKMGMAPSSGLTDFLMKKPVTMENFKTDILDTWYILPSGDIPPNPSELLGSQRMESFLSAAKKFFDYIVIDLPPVNIVSDALSVSSYTNGMIVVIREDYTEKKELDRCLRQLEFSGVPVLGCVLNESKGGGGSYKRYKRYQRYHYYQSSPSDKTEKK